MLRLPQKRLKLVGLLLLPPLPLPLPLLPPPPLLLPLLLLPLQCEAGAAVQLL